MLKKIYSFEKEISSEADFSILCWKNDQGGAKIVLMNI